MSTTLICVMLSLSQHLDPQYQILNQVQNDNTV